MPLTRGYYLNIVVIFIKSLVIMNTSRAYFDAFLIVISLLAGYCIVALRRRRREDVLLSELEQKLDRPGGRVILQPKSKETRT